VTVVAVFDPEIVMVYLVQAARLDKTMLFERVVSIPLDTVFCLAPVLS